MSSQNLSEQLMNNQPILNIGCLGSVGDGKSTTVYQLTGTKTQKHSDEKIRNITIKPGYANMKIWQSLETGAFITTNSKTNEINNHKLVHHLSFVDCPGHQELILTMMGSVSLMKGALVVISAAEPISKKPQLIQHLAAAKMSGMDNLIIIFNKLDLISKDVALERKDELDELLNKLGIVPKYIIPTALNKQIGLQNIIKAILEVFPPPLDSVENKELNTTFRITRSFDINKPGTNWDEIKGGVIGGSLINGNLKIGDTIEIRPGDWQKKKDGTFIVSPIKTTILSIESDKQQLTNLVPGGLTSIGTNIDSFYCKDDKLSGNILGLVKDLPDVYQEIAIKVNLTTQFEGNWIPKINNIVYLQIGNVNTEAELITMEEDYCMFKLSKPSCIYDNTLILICSKLVNDILRIVGYGNLISNKSKIINIL